MKTAKNLFVGLVIAVVFLIGALVWLCSGMNRRVEKFVVNLIDQLDSL